MDIDSMTPDELRRALRDALAENEALKRRLAPGTHVIKNDRWSVTMTDVYEVKFTAKAEP
jgi:hypothetical protein